VIRGIDQHRQERAAVAGAIQNKRKMEQDQAQFEATLKQKEDAAKQAQERWETEQEERKRVNDANITRGKATIAQGWARVESSNGRDAAYVKSLENKDGGEDGYQIAFTPNPGDKDVQTDNFGEPIKFASIPQAEADKLIVDALNDADFLKKNPQYNRVAVNGDVGRSLTTAERQDILVRYYQERYNRYWDAQNEQPSIEYTAPSNDVTEPWLLREQGVDPDDQFIE